MKPEISPIAPEATIEHRPNARLFKYGVTRHIGIGILENSHSQHLTLRMAQRAAQRFVRRTTRRTERHHIATVGVGGHPRHETASTPPDRPSFAPPS